ncbi:MAG TPA: septum formation initiator family protein [bacterium]|nr:septum formation initiator family protein [bacterium]
MTPRRTGRVHAVPTPAEARADHRRLMTIGAAAVLAITLTALFNQYGKTYTLARDETRLEQRRRDLIADNARLRDEIERLRTDDRYIEQIAREQLGLVRPGEVELLVVPYDGTVSAPGATPRGGTSAARSAGGRAVTPTPPANGARPADSSSPAAPATAPQPRRGIGVWAAGVRDAVLRLIPTLHR